MRLRTRHTGKTDTVPAVRDLHVQTCSNQMSSSNKALRAKEEDHCRNVVAGFPLV